RIVLGELINPGPEECKNVFVHLGQARFVIFVLVGFCPPDWGFGFNPRLQPGKALLIQWCLEPGFIQKAEQSLWSFWLRAKPFEKPQDLELRHAGAIRWRLLERRCQRLEVCL